MRSPAVLLLLADGRWPGGGYAHSGGLEGAVADGSVHDLATVESFVAGRLASLGVTDAWLAGWACSVATAHQGDLAAAESMLLHVQRHADARTPSPAMRNASRALGRGLRRAAEQCWSVSLPRSLEHSPIVLGVVAALAGLEAADAARLAVHHALFGPLNAVPKLLAIDMADICGVAVRLAPLADSIVAEAIAALTTTDPDEAPMWSAPLVEHLAEHHATWEVRLFAS